MEVIIAAVGIIVDQIIFGYQILQSYRALATKDDIKKAIKEAIAPLATKDEIREVHERIDDIKETLKVHKDLLSAHPPD